MILYDGLLDAAAEKIGSFFILPSSIHEVIFFPRLPEDVDGMSGMVKDVNSTEISADEVLSGNCYYYCAEARELKIAE